MFDRNEEVLNTSENTRHENTWAELTEVMKSWDELRNSNVKVSSNRQK